MRRVRALSWHGCVEENRAGTRFIASLLTLEQAAEALSVSVRHLLHLTTDGEIPFVNVGRGLRMTRPYEPEDIQAFIESRKVTHPTRGDGISPLI